MRKGYVYAGVNREAWPGLVKIGKTANPKKRLKALNSADTFTDFTYIIVLSCKEDMDFTERMIHSHFQSKRPKSNKEFFNISEEEVKTFFNNLVKENPSAYQIVDEESVPKNKSNSIIPPRGVDPVFTRSWRKNKEYKAVVEFTDEGWVLKKGSIIYGNENSPFCQGRLEAFLDIKQNSSIAKEGYLILTEDKLFNSVSAAISITEGYYAPKLRYWKNKDGIKLKDLKKVIKK